MERRLSAIMSADVVGYSRLMDANEVGTLLRFKEHRVQAIDPAIGAFGGRVFKLTGDGLLVEFPSVVGAVECAAQIQRDMRVRNCGVPDEQRIEFRIGINVGDVIIDEDDVFGHGVNLAARIEGVAKPGGIAVSGAVRDHVGNRLDFAFEDIGERALKNISIPVRVYQVEIDVRPAKIAGAAAETAADSHRPSIAVLPFSNMSGDPEQEFFSDGIAEDIITGLSKLSGLFVIGRNTSFTYKGKPVQLQETARQLGVRFLLEGSVRKVGERVRVTAQLVEGMTGGHLWAERFDRELTDIFAIQDDITGAIVDQLKIMILPRDRTAIGRAPTNSVEAYTYYLKGRHYFHNTTRQLLVRAREMFARAVELDSQYARAYAGIASCDARFASWYNCGPPPGEILAVANRALALDPELPEAHTASGVALATSGRTAEAKAEFERALELDPNDFDSNFAFGLFCLNQGQLERTASLYKRALESQPEDCQAALLLVAVLRSLGRFEEAEQYGRLGLKRAEEALHAHPENSRPAQLGAGTLAALGESELAKEWLARAMSIDPEDAVTRYNAACTYAQLGEIESSMEMLEAWSENPGNDYILWFTHDSDLDPIRAHSRYAALLAKLARIEKIDGRFP